MKPIKAGDPISARWLNQLAQSAGVESSPGWGGGLTSSSEGGIALAQFNPAQWFHAEEDFASHEDVYRGGCKAWWYHPADNEYAVRGSAVVVYSHNDDVSDGDVFPALFNVQSGRWEKIAGGGSGSDGGGGSNLVAGTCCSEVYARGSVLIGEDEWATDYTISFIGGDSNNFAGGGLPIPASVVVTNQGSYWESDEIDVTCGEDGTDTYIVTMTPTGHAPGECIIEVTMVTGGGYEGSSACCLSAEGGWSWRFVNCCIFDPLAGWKMDRDVSGFAGRECEVGPCAVCVNPDVKLCGGEENIPGEPLFAGPQWTGSPTLYTFTTPDLSGAFDHDDSPGLIYHVSSGGTPGWGMPTGELSPLWGQVVPVESPCQSPFGYDEWTHSEEEFTIPVVNAPHATSFTDIEFTFVVYVVFRIGRGLGEEDENGDYPVMCTYRLVSIGPGNRNIEIRARYEGNFSIEELKSPVTLNINNTFSFASFYDGWESHPTYGGDGRTVHGVTIPETLVVSPAV